MDTTGDKQIQQKHLKHSRPLKADEIIAQRSAVPAVSMRKRSNDKTTDGIIEPKRQRVSYVSHKELTRLRAIANGQSQTLVEVPEAVYDPWNEQQAVEPQDERFSFLPKPVEAKPPKSLRHKPISLAASGKSIPAVKAPDGGYSYNPVFDEYTQRLEKEGERELEKERKRLAEIEEEKRKKEAAARSAAEAEAAEAKAELSEWDEESAWEGFESGEDGQLTAKRPKPKTPQQRKKAIRRKEEERKAKMAADIRKKNEEASQARKLAESLLRRTSEDSQPGSDADDDSEEGDDRKLRRRKLGKIALPDKPLELVLPDELQESLRLLKPEGNLLGDRYRNLLVRGKLEARRPISFAKQAKRKVTEKWTHKDFMLH